jgi:hypothetical protein
MHETEFQHYKEMSLLKSTQTGSGVIFEEVIQPGIEAPPHLVPSLRMCGDTYIYPNPSMALRQTVERNLFSYLKGREYSLFVDIL